MGCLGEEGGEPADPSLSELAQGSVALSRGQSRQQTESGGHSFDGQASLRTGTGSRAVVNHPELVLYPGSAVLIVRNILTALP